MIVGLFSSEPSVSSSFFSARNLSANEVGGRCSASSSLPSGLVLLLAAFNGLALPDATAALSDSSLESWRGFLAGWNGEAKLCEPTPVYDLKALTEAPGARRLGLLLRAKPNPVVALLRLNPVGDLDRAAVAKGEDEEANASKPVRFVPVGEETSFGDVDRLDDEEAEANTDLLDLPIPVRVKGDGEGFLLRFDERLETAPLLVPANGEGEGVDLEPKIDGPLAEAKGEEVEA